MSAIEQIKELQRRIEDLNALADSAEAEAAKHREEAKAIGDKVSFALAVAAEYESKMSEEKEAVKELAASFREQLDDENKESFDDLMLCAGIEFEEEADANESENEGREEDSEGIVQELANTA